MYFPDPVILKTADETTAFLLLLWQELFDESSPDTFQPKLCDIPALVAELEEVASLAAKSDHWNKHLSEIRKELDANVRAGTFLLSRFPKYLWSLQHLVGVKDTYALHLNAKQLAVQAPEIADFFTDFYVGNLQSALAKMPHAKHDTVAAVNNLATHAVRAGSPRANMRSLADDTLFASQANTAVVALGNGCSPPQEEYRFVVTATGDFSHLQSILQRLEGLKILRQDERPTGTIADAFFAAHAKSFFNRHAVDARFIEGKTQASGQVAAARNALRTVRPVGDTFNFFANRLSLSFGLEVLVVNGGGVCERVNLAEQSLQRLQPRNDARQLTKEALMPPLKQKLEGRLFNAMELYSLALASTSTRVRLVNLWSALECLQGRPSEASIIERAVSLVAPLMAWRRVEKVLRYLAICLHEYRHKYAVALPVDEGFANSSRFAVQVEDLLHVLVKPKGHSHPASLAAFASGHVLLRYRLSRAWESLSRPEELQRELTESEQRVRWQLFRIYRARNLTVHHGHDTRLVTPMLDTLQYYLSVVLTRIVRELSTHPAWQLDDAITGLLREATYVRETLQRSPGALTTADFILAPDHRSAELLWPGS